MFFGKITRREVGDFQWFGTVNRPSGEFLPNHPPSLPGIFAKRKGGGGDFEVTQISYKKKNVTIFPLRGKEGEGYLDGRGDLEGTPPMVEKKKIDNIFCGQTKLVLILFLNCFYKNRTVQKTKLKPIVF